MTTENKVPPKKEKTAEQFNEAYKALCREYGFQLKVVPVYMARDDGTFSTVVQVSINKLEG